MEEENEVVKILHAQESLSAIDNRNNLYFTRVAQSSTGFDFLLWPSDLRIMPIRLQATELKIILQGIVS